MLYKNINASRTGANNGAQTLSLSKDSTLEEVFDFIRSDEHDVQVLPVTLNKPDDKWARMMVIIQGKPNTANHIMANIMTVVQDMFDQAEQHAASKAPKLVGSDGEQLTDDVKVLVPAANE